MTLSAAIGLAWLVVGTSPTQEPAPPPEVFVETIRPLLGAYCLECHSSRKHKGDLDLERFTSMARVASEPAVWQRVAEQLDQGAMPPEDAPQPADAELESLARWVDATLGALARADAGDPGPVVLRRLTNAEYTWTLRDLTGLADLAPAQEFPVDGAAGEGFTNVGQALVISPTLLEKYLDAAKGVAAHAVLLPDGLRFSPFTTQRDQTEELLRELRAFYAAFASPSGGEVVDLQGIVFATNEGGRLPLVDYLSATFELRDGAAAPGDVEAVARARGLSPRYLGTVLRALRATSENSLLAPLRARWRECEPDDAPALAARFDELQGALWKFNSVGHLGKAGGPKAWLEPVDPLTTRVELRHALPVDAGTDRVTLHLVADDAGDGDAHDVVRWDEPRFVAPGRPDLLLRDLPEVVRARTAERRRLFLAGPAALAAVDEATRAPAWPDVDALARRHGLDSADLREWLACAGLGACEPIGPGALFTTPLERASDHDFVTGWGDPATPIVVANASDREVRIPGTLKAHGVALHPSPTLAVVAGWRSPAPMTIRVDATVQHAHPDCGNGVTWSLELRRGTLRQILARGATRGGAVDTAPPIEALAVRAGDLVLLRIGAGNGDHSCDLTAVDLTLTSLGGDAQEWDLAADCSPDLLAANPHPDRRGNAGVWTFLAEADAGAPVPDDSPLAPWRTTASPAARARLARAVQEWLERGEADEAAPLVDAALDEAGLTVHAPSVVTVRVPADLVAGREFVTAGTLVDPEGSVQLQVLDVLPARLRVGRPAPFLVGERGDARARLAADLDEFRALFPPALCYAKIVPVDEVVTLTHFHREDDALVRLMLDEAQAAELDRLWDELRWVSRDALTQVDAFEQLWQYATQDADPAVFEPLRAPIAERAEAFRARLLAAEPAHLAAVLDLADRAWRRPLDAGERDGMVALYRTLREEGSTHDAAIRLLLARIWIAPSFLYRLEEPVEGRLSGPVSALELATRLSYFLWSSAPDEALRASAASGALHESGELAAQARRMLRDPKARRLAVEFACSWLHVYAFDEVVEKSERHFPTFAALRGAMLEETVLFLTDIFRANGSVLDLLEADYTFLDGRLAAHYGIPGVTGDEWRRVDGVRRFGRGGILTQATTLATQAGASRTSPILRGNWVSEVLLGEKLPRPPAGVPPLPEEETAATLSMRELTERHTRDPACATCHARIDPFGFSLEAYDAVGRKRDSDLAGRPLDTRVRALDGAEFEGVDGLRGYLSTTRRDSFVRQFCRKLLGYALGRAVRLSDEPLLAEMARRLEENDFRLDVAIEAIVQSPQFTSIRGIEDDRGQ